MKKLLSGIAVAFILLSCQTESMEETTKEAMEEVNLFVGTWETTHGEQTKKSFLTFTRNTYSLTYGDREGKETGRYSFGNGHIRLTDIVTDFGRYGQTEPERRGDTLGHYLFFENNMALIMNFTIVIDNGTNIGGISAKWKRTSL